MAEPPKGTRHSKMHNTRMSPEYYTGSMYLCTNVCMYYVWCSLYFKPNTTDPNSDDLHSFKNIDYSLNRREKAASWSARKAQGKEKPESHLVLKVFYETTVIISAFGMLFTCLPTRVFILDSTQLERKRKHRSRVTVFECT